MNKLIQAGRIAYAICIAGIGIQQFQYKWVRPVIAQAWPTWLQTADVAYVTGAALIVAAVIIIMSKEAKQTAFLLGCGFLFLFIVNQVPFQLFITPYAFSFGLWTDNLKELTLAGGAFVVASSYYVAPQQNSMPLSAASKTLLAACRVFFGITLVVFGIDHFLYTDFVAGLVPAWMPGHLFWTYTAGVALIGSGISLMLNIKLITVSLLLGSMLFLWLILLHIPRAVADPLSGKGNEVTSVFEALGFSGMAFMIAAVSILLRKPVITDMDKW